MVTAGLRWAPDMCPVDNIIIITVRPVAMATIMRVSDSCVFGNKMAMAVAKKMSIRVPMNSDPTCMYVFDIHKIYVSFRFQFETHIRYIKKIKKDILFVILTCRSYVIKYIRMLNKEKDVKKSIKKCLYLL